MWEEDCLYATYLVTRFIYQLYMSSLARVPEPTAFGGYYELYPDLFQGSRFPREFQQLHEQYGKYQSVRSSLNLLTIRNEEAFSVSRPTKSASTILIMPVCISLRY